ncbi:MAG: sigma-54 dependent transcriptional regulator [Desulfobulbaceae bacterium]|nr:sigma-54 dependent transcriptional regulator [Desulfobulbaceae bacterium]
MSKIPSPEDVRIFVVDDEVVTVRRVVQVLKNDGYRVTGFTDAPEAMSEVGKSPPDIIIMDVHLQDADGVELMQRVHGLAPNIAVILITGYASIEHAVQATKKGAFHYLAKPFKIRELRRLVGDALAAKYDAVGQNVEERVLKKACFDEIIGSSPVMLDVFNLISKIAPVDCHVVIQGESGTGKELVARALHKNSCRAESPFVSFNCGAFAEELVANELFGHEKGAFTGAASSKLGLLETGNGGTVFLDEVAEMPLSMQVKLLRVIQERNFMRVGGLRSLPLDVRFISATNRDMEKMIAEGEFRRDLYFRLKVVLVKIPPLRERGDDISLLCFHFAKKISERFGRPVPTITEGFIKPLLGYEFPGNVRELEHIVEHAIALSEKNVLDVSNLPEELLSGRSRRDVEDDVIGSLKKLEKNHIYETYRSTGYNQSETARILGISRTTLWRRLKEFDIPGS